MHHQILFCCTFTSLLLIGCGQNKFQQEVEKENIAVPLARETVEGNYELITTDELKAALDAKEDFILIDSMPYEASYKSAHIPTAESFEFPIPAMEEWDASKTGGKSQEDFQKLLGEDKQKLIIVYCGFVKCTRSHNAALWAKKLGYENVKRHPGGIYAWKGAGYPTDSVK